MLTSRHSTVIHVKTLIDRVVLLKPGIGSGLESASTESDQTKGLPCGVLFSLLFEFRTDGGPSVLYQTVKYV
jgi:hypothetical protein